jgi:hypothetical protein
MSKPSASGSWCGRAAPQSAPPNTTRHLLPALYKASKNAQLLHINPEDGNCKFAETMDNCKVKCLIFLTVT